MLSLEFLRMVRLTPLIARPIAPIARCASRRSAGQREPEASPTLSRALAAGRPVDAETGGIAALISGRYRPRPGERVGVVVSGANTTAVDFAR
jgi:hypothetical protein